MFTTEQCEKILDIAQIKFNSLLTLDCQMNILHIHSKKQSITLSETQKRLLVCLKNKIDNKRDIINIVWYENHKCVRDNNYHQLVFQLRALFERNMLPAKLIVTVPYYGLKFNEPLMANLEQDMEQESHTHCKESRFEPAQTASEKTQVSSLCQWLMNAIR